MISSRRMWLYTGERPSNGARELAAQPGFLRLRPDRFHKVRQGDVVVNWGTTAPLNDDWPVFNDPPNVKAAVDKLEAFSMLRMSNVSTPDWTPKQSVAQSWHDDGCTVVVRNKLTGHSGDGIVIIEKRLQGEASKVVPAAPLYTKYVFKEKEYRVHVVCGKVVDTARKIKDPDREVKFWKVRSHDNGFIFARNGIEPSEARDDLALSAVLALGLDFGAVDIIDDKKGNLYVLEVNTAPGIEGQTIQSYAEAFRGCKG